MRATRRTAVILTSLLLAFSSLPWKAFAQAPGAIQVQDEIDESDTPPPQPPLPNPDFDDPESVSFAMLPNAPGWTLPAPPRPMKPCPDRTQPAPINLNAAFIRPNATAEPCIEVNPFQRFLNSTNPIPLSPRQKGHLALRNFADPANLITIVGTAAFTVGTNAHTAYGPGFKGFGRNTGYSFSQDATGEFFGTFLIPSLLHEDPHYHRLPQASVPRRILHAISRTVIAQHDDGRMMPNYATLLTYPISAEISNLYVPGVNGNAASTARRIATGLATDPVGNLITEFLPDLARHINIRAIFVQRILNAVTAGSTGGTAVAAP